MIAIRWLVSMLLALLITVGLFYLMQALIATGAQLESRVNVVKIVDATQSSNGASSSKQDTDDRNDDPVLDAL